jgi:hypothetical protein
MRLTFRGAEVEDGMVVASIGGDETKGEKRDADRKRAMSDDTR